MKKILSFSSTNTKKFAFFVCTTKKESEKEEIPLVQSLLKMNFGVGCGVSVDVFAEFQNTQGLSHRYNEFIDYCKGNYSYIAFIHDDVWINDVFFFDKVINSKFDVIGNVGGLQYIPPKDWKTRPFLWTEACRGKASGFVLHKHPNHDDMFIPSSFGLSPLPCVWLDGQMLILNKKSILSGLRFCEDYTFDFYDGSLCGMARKMGLKVGTAPILATHESCGQGMMAHKEEYLESQRRFIEKWF